MAQSGHGDGTQRCPLLEVKETSGFASLRLDVLEIVH